MLACGDVELPAEPFTAFTPRTITTRGRLIEELARVRRLGFAEAREEREEGLAAVAAPVWDSRGELAGIIGAQGPASRFDARAARAAVPLLLEHSVAVSRELGWQS
jgi:DNA-binding IclR family transcriptional regulator